MFGYIIVNKQELKFREFDVYQSYYCGLCQSLKERFGRRGQLTLSYDMTFVARFCLRCMTSRWKAPPANAWRIRLKRMRRVGACLPITRRI